jgi:hypothetical protein
MRPKALPLRLDQHPRIRVIRSVNGGQFVPGPCLFLSLLCLGQSDFLEITDLIAKKWGHKKMNLAVTPGRHHS